MSCSDVNWKMHPEYETDDEEDSILANWQVRSAKVKYNSNVATYDFEFDAYADYSNKQGTTMQCYEGRTVDYKIMFVQYNTVDPDDKDKK